MTTDAGYHETVGQVPSYRNKAALCVEMEGGGLLTMQSIANKPHPAILLHYIGRILEMKKRL